MSLLRVESFSLSLDGFAGGPEQSLENPNGLGGLEIHEWFFPTAIFQQSVYGKDGGTTGIDNDFAARALDNVGAWIMGRNMFGPIRDRWPDEQWRGWWGENPPFHVPVFVLTHHPRPPVTMTGGTTFHFVTDGIHAALERAKAAAGDKDVRLGGGVVTIQQYLQARLVDRLHLAVTPVVLGSGENLFAGINLRALGYRCAERVATPQVTHLILERT